MKRIIKTVALTLAVVLVIGAAIVANALFGNPVSKALAKNSAKRHLEESYKNTDLEITAVSYSFKDGYYYVYVESESSIDTHFVLMMNSLGQLHYDDYESVSSGRNTADRINNEYRARVESVLDSASIPYYVSIGFGEIVFEMPADTETPAYAMDMSELILDKEYDMRELGAKAGKLTLYIEDETVSVERLAEILISIRVIFDDAGVRFYAIDCVLEYPIGDDCVSREGHVEVAEFLYSDIYEQGMTERVEKANNETNARLESTNTKESPIN